ncbi:MAG: GNAT family N-acetyltransferase, partial [Thermoplasmata archaeon]
MVDIKVVPFDPKRATRGEWAAYHRYRRARHQETDPNDPILADATAEAHERTPDTAWKEIRSAILDAERPEEWIGWQDYEIAHPDGPSFEENKHILWLWISLLPSYRKRGIGRLLLRRAARYAREHDKSLVISYSEEADGLAFWRAVGAQDAQRTRQSRLKLETMDWAMVEQWVAEGPARSPAS